MSELIDYKIVCSECKHHNKFRVKGEIIPLYMGGEFPVVKESLEGKICEGCGRELRT